ncbi:MAG: tetratricopeptide repeat protein [Planctomycetota bacterium]|jgi:tetratricopeptide (TPR) repeat protein
MPEVAETMEIAVRHHQAGRLQQAQRLYHQVLQTELDHPVALHLSGLIAYQTGRFQEAVDLVDRAIKADTRIPKFYNTFGVALEALGKYKQAVDAYQQAVSLRPDYVEAYNNMAVALQSQGSYAEAVDKCRQAILFKPNYAEAYHTMGFSLARQGYYNEAIESYSLAIKFKPGFAEAYNHLGLLLNDQCRHAEAAENLAKAIELESHYTEAYNNLAIALKSLGRFDEAVANYERAIRLDPNFAEAYYNLANTLKEQGRCDQAVENYNNAIRLKPDYAQAYWNQSHAFLLNGQFVEGWKGYQWRRNEKLNIITYPHRHYMPRWDGSAFVGSRLLVHCEQGLGDSLQFIRYLPMVKERGGTLILEAWKPLHGLLHKLSYIDKLVELSFDIKTDVEFDFFISIMDLPVIFETTLETIPNNVPYIFADSTKVQYWHDRIAGTGFKVGVVWAGAPEHGNDGNRSCVLEDFLPLAAIDGLQFYGLQTGPAAAQIKDLHQDIVLPNLAEQFEDFTDTAAVIISVDTAVLHLAGAMAKPVWALLPFAPDWRWMLDRQDSPWYPTMKLFRQENWGDWDDVFSRVAEQLRILVAKTTVPVAGRI